MEAALKKKQTTFGTFPKLPRPPCTLDHMGALREGSKKKKCKSMVFDHTPLTPPPLKHIYGPLIAIF